MPSIWEYKIGQCGQHYVFVNSLTTEWLGRRIRQ